MNETSQMICKQAAILVNLSSQAKQKHMLKKLMWLPTLLWWECMSIESVISL